VHVHAESLFARCRVFPHLVWVHPGGGQALGESIAKVQLDDDGNAFLIVFGLFSCTPGTSQLEVDLESKPFTTYTGTFEVHSPTPGI